jgi:hypothetical protein
MRAGQAPKPWLATQVRRLAIRAAGDQAAGSLTDLHRCRVSVLWPIGPLMRKAQAGPCTPTDSDRPIVFFIVVLCAAAAIVIAVLIVGVHYFLPMFSRMNRPSLAWLLFLDSMRFSPLLTPFPKGHSQHATQFVITPPTSAILSAVFKGKPRRARYSAKQRVLMEGRPVLIVDDSEDTRDMLVTWLESAALLCSRLEPQ